MHALLIDDSRAHRLVTGHSLEDLGFEVTEAENSAEAATCLKKKTKFDLVLVDWEMPRMNGLEFIRNVRADPIHGTTPIILLGTTKFHDHLIEALEAGANEYIMKPFTKDVLEMKLQILGIDAG